MDEARTRPGTTVADRFLLRRQLGRGGMATIWLATDLHSREQVALKVLHPQFRASGDANRRFSLEANVLAALAHPNIARVLSFEFDAVQPFFALEYIAGTPLDRAMGTRAELEDHFSSREVVQIFSQLASALDFAHAQNVVHRDLKPSNVMIVDAQDDLHVKVLDFGIAKILDGHSAETTQGRMVGTVSFMSPEQAAGDAVDGRSDVFSLGVMLFEILTLRRAWARTDGGEPMRAYAEPVRPNEYNGPVNTARRLADEPRPRPSEFRPGISRALDDVVMRAMAIDVEARYATAAHMLADVLAQFPEEASRLPNPNEDRTELHQRSIETQVVRRRTAKTLIREPVNEPTALVQTRLVGPPVPRPPVVSSSAPHRAVWLAVAAAVVACVLGFIGGLRFQSASEPAPAAPAVVSGVRVDGPTAVHARPSVTAKPAEPPEPAIVPVHQPAVQRPAPPPNSRAPRTSKPVDPSNSALIRVRAAVQSASSEPDDVDRLAKAGEAISRAADKLSDEKKRSRIKRLASSSAMLGDIAGVKLAARELEAALRD